MAAPRSDALVFFGATGDLAFKQVFPALQAMIRHGHLDMPVIGVSRSSTSVDQLRARAHDSLTQHGGVDDAAFAKLSSLLQAVGGDYNSPDTYTHLRQTLGSAAHPLHYLAIPPSLFETVAAASRSPAAPLARVSSSRSRLGATSPRPANSTACCSNTSPKGASSALTTI